MKRIPLMIACAVIAAACHPIPHEESYDTGHESDVVGLAFMSQMMIVAGAPGLALFPFLIAADIHATNEAMVRANTNATLEQTYRYAYDRDLASVGTSGSTGQIFRELKSATVHFRTILRGHGVANPDDFVLTAVRTADQQGYTLFALVYRPQRSVEVRMTSGRISRLTEADMNYYRPIRSDAFGNPVDVVVDWAGVERRSISNQKGQAILLTLAANSVLINRRSNDFWSARQRWINGQFREIVADKKREIDRRLGQS